MRTTHINNQQGFTLIEMIVSLGVFAMVATTAVGALLMLVATNEQLQVEQGIMSNLSFALDSMTREIRTGTDYFCDARPTITAAHPYGIGNIFNPSNNLDEVLFNEDAGGQWTQDCSANDQNFRGLAFVEGGDSVSGSNNRILYYFNADEGKIYRRIGDNDPQSIVSSGVYIQDFQFIVTGSNPSDDIQPRVTILIKASEADGDEDSIEKIHRIETTVTQRTIDI